MSYFAPLIRLDVVHDYFADPARLVLDFQPDARTAEWLEAAGCVMRADENRLYVFYDAEARGGVTGREPTELRFDVTADDPLFVEFTADWPGGGPGAPWIRGEDAKVGKDGVWRLVPEAGSQQAVAPPGVHFRLSFPVGGPAAAGRRYRLDLASRATAWKYILLDDWGAVTPVVVDPARLVSFSAAAPEPIADGRPALAITSTEAIPLSDRPAQRFQLRADGADTPLIDILPAAAPGRLGLDGPAAKSRMVSEIYVAHLMNRNAPHRTE